MTRLKLYVFDAYPSNELLSSRMTPEQFPTLTNGLLPYDDARSELMQIMEGPL
jgi:hypothetical protein